MEKGKSQTELKHSLMWYVEHYGLPLSTVKNNRAYLDRPKFLQLKLNQQPGPTPNLDKFIAYWSARPNREFI